MKTFKSAIDGNCKKFEWRTNEGKELILQLLVKHNGSVVEIAKELNMAQPSVTNGIKRHYPDINTVSYLPLRERFHKDSATALLLAEECNFNVPTISEKLDGLRFCRVRKTLEKFNISYFN